MFAHNGQKKRRKDRILKVAQINMGSIKLMPRRDEYRN